MLEEDARSVAIRLLSPQLTACFTSALILASSAAVNSTSAKAIGHRAPSSRFNRPERHNSLGLLCAIWDDFMVAIAAGDVREAIKRPLC
jgi:hypothetical protein